MRRALVCGAGGFIGSHLVKRLKQEGFWIRGVDLKQPEFSASQADEFVEGDLRDPAFCRSIADRPFDEVYQLAADMGGARYIFSGENDAEIMRNSSLINLGILDACRESGAKRVFYSSSACVYPDYRQSSESAAALSEDLAYPAQPDSEYGWEKLFSERLYLAYQRNHEMPVRIARYHNIFGPEGTWNNGREKSPAALCRKTAECKDGGEIEIWGDGEQTRSFLYIDECLEGTLRLMRSDWSGPVNIGSDEMVTINQLAQMIMRIAGKQLTLHHVEGPLGVRSRNSDNQLIQGKLGWRPTRRLMDGLRSTYLWIERQVRASG